MKIEVHLQGGLRKIIDITPGATVGATIGKNVFNADGTLFVPSTGGGSQPVAVTSWELILNIPPNVAALANTATTGLYVITADGASATRSITPTAGETTVSNGDGVAGDPQIGLADVTPSTGGSIQRLGFDAKGRRSQADTATTDNLPEGVTNLYFTNGRAQDAVGAILTATADIEWTYGLGSIEAKLSAAVHNSLDLADSALQASALPPGYIDGLYMSWDNATSITVSSGSAYVESAGAIITLPSAIALTGLSLTAFTFYHVYLYLNSGVPDIELSPTAPATPYSGTARSKTGDPSRRYVGSVLAIAGGVARFVQNGLDVFYLENINADPFRLIPGGGTATVPTTLSTAGAIPLTSRNPRILANNNASNAIVFVSNSEAYAPLSAVNWLSFINIGNSFYTYIPTDAAREFSYMYNVAPTGGAVFMRVAGYLYER